MFDFIQFADPWDWQSHAPINEDEGAEPVDDSTPSLVPDTLLTYGISPLARISPRTLRLLGCLPMLACRP